MNQVYEDIKLSFIFLAPRPPKKSPGYATVEPLGKLSVSRIPIDQYGYSLIWF